MRTALIMVQFIIKDDAYDDARIKSDVEAALARSLPPWPYGVAAVVKIELEGDEVAR